MGVTLGTTAIAHMLRAAGEVTGQRRFVLVGAAAVIAWFGSVPADLANTGEIDIYAPDATDPEEVAFELEASLGQGSPFFETYGYFVDGVSPATARLPDGWRSRAQVRGGESTNGVIAVVPDPNDIAVSKLARALERDMDFLVAGLGAGLFDIATIIERSKTVDLMNLQQGEMTEKVDRLLGRMKTA